MVILSSLHLFTVKKCTKELVYPRVTGKLTYLHTWVKYLKSAHLIFWKKIYDTHMQCCPITLFFIQSSPNVCKHFWECFCNYSKTVLGNGQVPHANAESERVHSLPPNPQPSAAAAWRIFPARMDLHQRHWHEHGMYFCCPKQKLRRHYSSSSMKGQSHQLWAPCFCFLLLDVYFSPLEIVSHSQFMALHGAISSYTVWQRHYNVMQTDITMCHRVPISN